MVSRFWPKLNKNGSWAFLMSMQNESDQCAGWFWSVCKMILISVQNGSVGIRRFGRPVMLRWFGVLYSCRSKWCQAPGWPPKLDRPWTDFSAHFACKITKCFFDILFTCAKVYHFIPCVPFSKMRPRASSQWGWSKHRKFWFAHNFWQRSYFSKILSKLNSACPKGAFPQGLVQLLDTKKTKFENPLPPPSLPPPSR